MKKIKLTPKDKEAILQAVTQAEKNTSGEISTALIKESSDYVLYELSLSLLAGLLAALAFHIWGSPWQNLWNNLRWGLTPSQLSSITSVAIFIIIGLTFLLANTAFIDRLIVPKSIIRQRVKDQALLHFFKSGLTETKDRCAILIFISTNERKVELIADSGISAKIEPKEWAALVDSLTGSIKENQMTTGLIKAIEQCGSLLSLHFPQKEEKKKQLTNTIQILEV
ncbi:MAG: hypothetical protein PF447_08455 [Spirochaetaceae bacterium]|jgi:putative membrane protein|nr:hypothetical protein [Spirochaetaceae bacterium]